MAYLNNTDQQTQDKEYNPNQTQSSGPTQPISVSGTSAAPSGQGSAAAPGIQSSNSGRFQNLQNYLSANSGYNKDSGGLAGQIGGDLNKKEQGIQQNIQDQQNNWYSQAQNSDQNTPYIAQSYIDNALANPSNADATRFQNYLTAADRYKAPTQGYDAGQQVQGEIKNYQDLANKASGATGSEAGRYSLLQSLYGNPNYSAGQQKLDNLFLQADPNQLNQLNKYANDASGLNTAYQNAQDTIKRSIAQYGQNAQDVQKYAQQALGGAISDFQKQAADAVTNAANVRNDRFKNEQGVLSQDQLPPDLVAQFQAAGINPGQALFNLHPQDYLTEATTTPTAQNVITPEQQARIEALAKLGGNNLTGDASQIVSSFLNNKDVGSFAKASPYTFDVNKFQTDLGKINGDINSQINNIVSGLAPRIVTNGGNWSKDNAATLYKQIYDEMQVQNSPTFRNQGMFPQQLYATEQADLDKLGALMSTYGLNSNTGLSNASLAGIKTGTPSDYTNLTPDQIAALVTKLTPSGTTNQPNNPNGIPGVGGGQVGAGPRDPKQELVGLQGPASLTRFGGIKRGLG